MIRITKLVIIMVLGLQAFVKPSFAVEKNFVFIGDLSLLGMLTYFEGNRSSVTGYLSADIAPAYSINKNNSIIANYRTKYQGTQQVQELLGGGTLYQEEMNHSIVIKWLRDFGNGVQLKPKAGYFLSFVKETKDEDWGDGLYDYRRLNFGLNLEKKWTGGDF